MATKVTVTSQFNNGGGTTFVKTGNRYLQSAVLSQQVTIVGIFITTKNLTYSLTYHLAVSMRDEELVAIIRNE